MISKIMPITREVNKPLLRSNLKKTSYLKDLNTRLQRDLGSFTSPHDMVIPGGMTQKEELVYKLTGKFPKSVTERWYQVFGSDAKNIAPDDQLISVSTETLANTGYGDGAYASHATLDDYHEEGFISKIINHFLDD